MFEGRFALQAQAGVVSVSESGVPDPSGEGRTRVIRKKEHGRWGSRRVEGEVHWSSDFEERQSSLVAETRAGSVKVTF